MTLQVEKDPSLWSVDEVYGFLWNQGFLEEAEKCRDQHIDGQVKPIEVKSIVDKDLAT
jgi:hypothetical protein